MRRMRLGALGLDPGAFRQIPFEPQAGDPPESGQIGSGWSLWASSGA
jgi:hypothetical protein